MTEITSAAVTADYLTIVDDTDATNKRINPNNLVKDTATVAANTTHKSSDGSDHTFIDQDVTSGSTPTLTATNITGIVAAGLNTDAVETAKIKDVNVTTAKIADDAVTYAKIQNVVNDERLLGRVSGANGVIEELTAAQVGTFLNNVIPAEVGIAVSDETTALTAPDLAKATFRMPFAMTLTDVRASVTTAPTGSVLTVDINESGTTILSTKITIDATEKTSTTADIPPVGSDADLADDAEITIDIDTVGSTIAGAGLKIWLIGTRA